MAELIFPDSFDEKCTIAQDDYILMADSEDWNKIKKAKYSFLKWEKWDTWETGPQWCQWPQWEQGPQGCQGEQGPQWCQGETGCQWPEWPSICSASFNCNDIVFQKDNGCCVVLENAKLCLQWPQGEQGPQGCQWPQGEQWPQWCQGPQGCQGEQGPAGNWICCTELNESYWLVIHYTDWTCDTTDSIRWPQGPQGCQWEQGCQWIQWPEWPQGCQWPQWCTWEQWPAWVGICCSTCSKVWKTTTVELQYTNNTCFCFSVDDWQDWQWSGDMLKCVYDPNNTGCPIPTDNCQIGNGCGYAKTWDIPTDNCQLWNSCWYIKWINCSDVTTALGYTPYDNSNPSGYTSCTGTLVPSDLNNYAKCCDIPDISWKADCWDIPTDNCQLWNGCWYAKSCDLSTVATSWKYCDLSWQPTIPTDNCQLWNGCGYTKCTWTLSTCSDIINTLWYTPYDSSNPSWYTWCTWDIEYSNFWFNTVSGATVTISNLSTKITPSANFTVSVWTVKEWMQYILRVNSWATAYTMSLGTGITNPFSEDLTLTANKTTTVVFLATSSSALELFSIRTAE